MTEVSLFSTCLAEEFYPSAVDAAARVLRDLRLKVRPIRRAFCCGQAAFNEGMREQAVELAGRFLSACEPGTPVVVPSGSCAAMVKNILCGPAGRRSETCRQGRRAQAVGV